MTVRDRSMRCGLVITNRSVEQMIDAQTEQQAGYRGGDALNSGGADLAYVRTIGGISLMKLLSSDSDLPAVRLASSRNSSKESLAMGFASRKPCPV